MQVKKGQVAWADDSAFSNPIASSPSMFDYGLMRGSSLWSVKEKEKTRAQVTHGSTCIIALLMGDPEGQQLPCNGLL